MAARQAEASAGRPVDLLAQDAEDVRRGGVIYRRGTYVVRSLPTRSPPHRGERSQALLAQGHALCRPPA